MDELHGAAQAKHCRWLAKQFNQQGRNVRLKEVRRERNPGAALQYTCVFEGRDALYGAKLSRKLSDQLWRKS